MAGRGPVAEGKSKLGRAFADVFDLPRDAVADLPRILLVGDAQVRIDNHRGLIACSMERVVIGIGTGQLTIAGEGLVIDHAYQDRVFITGVIRQVTFE